MKSNKVWFVALVVLLGGLLRGWAAWQLPLDADEPGYLQAGFDYARLLRAGDVSGVIDYPINREHPPLVKLLYSLPVLALGDRPSFDDALLASRLISAFFGTLAVGLMALLSPLAGLLLAVQTLVVKYTSQAYLEALPFFAMLLAMFAMLRSRHSGDRWFWVSSAALGLAAAGKYSYFPILIVILYLYFWEKKYPVARLPLYLLAAAGVFLALDPALWRDPAGQLFASLFFHTQYSQSAHVQLSGYPWYQPFIWVSRSMPYTWHPEVFFYYGFDGLIALLAVLGLRWEWAERRWVVVWFVSSMIFLLLWPTKWPQYALVALPAVCLAAQSAIVHLYRRAREAELYWNWLEDMFPRPSKGHLAALAAVVLLATLGQLIYTVNRALLNRGWWQLNTENSMLPSNAVYSVLPVSSHEMLAAGERGVVIFSLSADTGLPQAWQVFDPTNSRLPSFRVLSALRDAQGELWVGTDAGLARFDGEEWAIYTAVDLGVESAAVQSLAQTTDGRLWSAVGGELVVFDGAAWEKEPGAGLPGQDVVSLVVSSPPGDETLWAATRASVSRLDVDSGQWHSLPPIPGNYAAGGVSSLTADSAGGIWVATLGSGLHRWDGQAWTSYLVSDSGIPSNTVQRVYESQPGLFWVATSSPTEVGGVLARFDGQHWQAYTRVNSGFTGAEPLAMALDPLGRLWIGTRTAGVEIFQYPHGKGER